MRSSFSASRTFIRRWSRRRSASLSSRRTAGTSRTRLPLAMKSCAPWRMAAVTTSSGAAPDTMRNGRSGASLRITSRAPAELKAGSRWSQMTRSQSRSPRACSMAARVSTRAQATWNPPLRSSTRVSSASSSLSSTRSAFRS